jgi:hypothetical protein
MPEKIGSDALNTASTASTMSEKQRLELIKKVLEEKNRRRAQQSKGISTELEGKRLKLPVQNDKGKARIIGQESIQDKPVKVSAHSRSLPRKRKTEEEEQE